MKFKDDLIDETPTLAQTLSTDSAISSILDLSIRMLPGDHGLPLQQVSVVFIICVNIAAAFSISFFFNLHNYTRGVEHVQHRLLTSCGVQTPRTGSRSCET